MLCAHSACFLSLCFCVCSGTKFVSGLLFFGYMFLVCVAFFVLTGTIGYFACFMFVTKIYASIKID